MLWSGTFIGTWHDWHHGIASKDLPLGLQQQFTSNKIDCKDKRKKTTPNAPLGYLQTILIHVCQRIQDVIFTPPSSFSRLNKKKNKQQNRVCHFPLPIQHWHCQGKLETPYIYSKLPDFILEGVYGSYFTIMRMIFPARNEQEALVMGSRDIQPSYLCTQWSCECERLPACVYVTGANVKCVCVI